VTDSPEGPAGPVDDVVFTSSGSGSRDGRSKRARQSVTLLLLLGALVVAGVIWYVFSGSAATGVNAASARQLSAAAAHTLDAASYTADETISLGFSATASADLPLAHATLVFQAPNRVDENLPISLLARATVIEIGKDCWISGVPRPDLTSGAVSCGSLTTSGRFESLLGLLAHAPSVSTKGDELVYTPADPTEFLRQSSIQVTIVPGATLVVKVDASTRGQYLGTVTVLVTQSGGSAGMHAATSSSVTLTFSSIGHSVVARPQGQPTEVNGVLTAPTIPVGAKTEPDQLLHSAASRTAEASGFLESFAGNVGLGAGGGGTLFQFSGVEDYQGPDSAMTRVAGSAGSTAMTVTQIGNDCWYVGVSTADAGTSACKAGGPQRSVLGPLRVLESATGVSCRTTICTFDVPTPETFLTDAAISYSPFGGWGLPVKLVVEVTIRGGLVVGEQMTATQTSSGSNQQTLSVGVFSFGYTQVSSAPPVLRPSSAPSAVASS
jgi:hypothetical protein